MQKWRLAAVAQMETHIEGQRLFSVILVVTALVGAVCQAVSVLIEVGRSAGWWQ
jgi:hypothetical protein